MIPFQRAGSTREENTAMQRMATTTRFNAVPTKKQSNTPRSREISCCQCRKHPRTAKVTAAIWKEKKSVSNANTPGAGAWPSRYMAYSCMGCPPEADGVTALKKKPLTA